MKLTTFLFVIAVFVIGAGIFWQIFTEKPVASLLNESVPLTNPTIIVYENKEKEKLSVAYQGDKAEVIVDGALVQVTQTESASGVKYTNDQSGIVVWNKGDDVTVTNKETLIFSGTEQVLIEDFVDEDLEGENNQDHGTSTTKKSIIGSWRWVKTEIKDGETITPKQDVFTLTFSEDGSIQGKTDCNGFGGSYIYENNLLKIENMISTMMFCEGSEEQEFTSWLQTQLAVSISDGLLILKNDGQSLEFKTE